MVARTKTENGQARAKIYAPRKLSLACGVRKPEGFFGVDLRKVEGVDATFDLLTFPWPIKTNAVHELECSHFVEHIPHWRPGWEKDGFFLFFDEVYRICARNAECLFIHPYCMNGRAFWDPTHERYIHETTWVYLNRDWRVREGLDHYPTDVNFEVVNIDGVGVPDAIATRHHDAQQFARNHYWNCIEDVVIRLKVLK